MLVEIISANSQAGFVYVRGGRGVLIEQTKVCGVKCMASDCHAEKATGCLFAGHKCQGNTKSSHMPMMFKLGSL